MNTIPSQAALALLQREMNSSGKSLFGQQNIKLLLFNDFFVKSAILKEEENRIVQHSLNKAQSPLDALKITLFQC